ncbi:similar to Saccharomyces cerevisiae YGL246C RAI1 Nuclear protein with decapping endonuclease activity targeted toward mRNAs with unmethylated 7-methylguanosine cap structures [Maudiozyma saulgeensis]|uniref:Decapping nuclease n=1 Tax=Maudiozyma saulgeensis TaxID=1789683 RepID=A0A1X7QXX8_9SACH|nr:similar to Saccharomyces cerevisiae YGL246C RAI1 Nuclear protein with decapping endonuclease activity targeted toward mRNAs with unmethylated 7-methylguanosine cap structures [Kazachstania saulgeensis]
MAITSNLFINQKGSTTALKQPREIGYYSRNQNEEYLIQQQTQLKYYYLPNSDLERNLDLSSGLKKFKNCESTFQDPNTIHGLLKSIQHTEQHKGKKVKGDIIANTTTITKLILSAFDNTNINPIDMIVVSFDGQLFIKERQQTVSSTVDANKYTNYKFKALSTISQPLPLESREVLEKRHRKLCNNGDKYVSVTKTGVGKVKLILSTDIDCIFDFKEESKDNLKHYTQLVCNPTVNTISESHKFENGMFRIWLKCFLAGIPRIICGFKDDSYVLKTVEEFATNEIPVLLKENNPEVGSKCLDAIKWYGLFTEWLLKIIPHSDTKEIKPFKLILADNHLKLHEIETNDSEFENYVQGEGILSSEFKEWRNSL